MSVVSSESTLASSPAFDAVKARLAALKGELVKVLTGRDVFLEDELPNLEALWLRELGSLELELLGLEVEARGARRFLELLRAQASRGDRLDVAAAAAQVEVELSDWHRQVETKAKEVEKAREHLSRLLTPAATVKLRRVFHGIARRLHPDVNPERSPAEITLWHRALEAYRAADLEALGVVALILEDLPAKMDEPSAMDDLERRCAELKQRIGLELQKTDDLKRQRGYEALRQVEDAGWLEARRTDLAGKIAKARAWRDALVAEADLATRGSDGGNARPN